MERGRKRFAQQFLSNGLAYRRPRSDSTPSWHSGHGLNTPTPPFTTPTFSGCSLPSAGAHVPTANVSAAVWIPVTVDAFPGPVGAFSWVPTAVPEAQFFGPAVRTLPEGSFPPPTPVYFMAPGAAAGTVVHGVPGAVSGPAALAVGAHPASAATPVAVDRHQTSVEAIGSAQPTWSPIASASKGTAPDAWNNHAICPSTAISASSCSTHCTRLVEENARDVYSDISSLTFSPELPNGSERLADRNSSFEKPLSLDAAQRALRIFRWRQKRRAQVEAFRLERERNPDRRRAVAKRRPRIGGRFVSKALELSMLSEHAPTLETTGENQV